MQLDLAVGAGAAVGKGEGRRGGSRLRGGQGRGWAPSLPFATQGAGRAGGQAGLPSTAARDMQGWLGALTACAAAAEQGRGQQAARAAVRVPPDAAPPGQPAPPTTASVWPTNHTGNSLAGPVVSGSSGDEGQEGQAEQGQGLQGAAPTAGGGGGHDGHRTAGGRKELNEKWWPRGLAARIYTRISAGPRGAVALRARAVLWGPRCRRPPALLGVKSLQEEECSGPGPRRAFHLSLPRASCRRRLRYWPCIPLHLAVCPVRVVGCPGTLRCPSRLTQ